MKPYTANRISPEQSAYYHSDIYKCRPHSSASAGGDVWFPHIYFDAYDYVGDVSFNVVRTNNKKNYRFVPLKLDAVVMCRWKDFAMHVDPISFFLNPITPPSQIYREPAENGDGMRSVHEGADPQGGTDTQAVQC